MRPGLDPFQFLVFSIAGWMNHQQHAVDYLIEENRVLRMRTAWRHAQLLLPRRGLTVSRAIFDAGITAEPGTTDSLRFITFPNRQGNRSEWTVKR
jgi:hypothetical protein